MPGGCLIAWRCFWHGFCIYKLVVMDTTRITVKPNKPESEFADVQTFRELFRLLDARRTLWGSQKRYTADELKVLINRVRTRNPALHLPLDILPATGGLRIRVKALVTAEALGRGREGHL
jgi:hypothetical protein